MKKEQWLRLKTGDVIYSLRTGKPRRIINSRKTIGGSVCIELESGAVYCTAERILFKANP